MQIRMLRGELHDVLRQEVSLVGGWIVVEHARELRRTDNGADVRLHLAPIGAVNIRRQHHQTGASCLLCATRKLRGFGSTERCDTEHHWRLLTDSTHTSGRDGELLLETQRRRFTQR